MKDVIYLDLKTTDGTKLFIRPERFLEVKKELIDFLKGERHLCTKVFAKTVMFSHELKANNFYRGNPYINQVGTLLGLTSQQLDEFFETNDYTKLI